MAQSEWYSPWYSEWYNSNKLGSNIMKYTIYNMYKYGSYILYTIWFKSYCIQNSRSYLYVLSPWPCMGEDGNADQTQYMSYII